ACRCHGGQLRISGAAEGKMVDRRRRPAISGIPGRRHGVLTMKILVIAFFVSSLTCELACAGNTKDVPLSDPVRFGSYADNSATYGRMSNDGWAGKDEYALRANYSLSYLFSGREKYDFLFSYTGAFDFYVGTRPSGPVVNRLSNPALHLIFPAGPNQRPRALLPLGRTRLDVGVEHESDGQTTEVLEPADRAIVRSAYAAKDHRFFDGISRGSNFVSLTGQLAQ